MGTEGRASNKWLVAALVFLAVTSAFQGIALWGLKSQVDHIATFRATPDEKHDVPTDKKASAQGEEPGPVPVPGISKPDSYVRDAVTEVENALAQMARAEEAYRLKHGEFLGDPIKLLQRVGIPPEVEVIQILADSTAFCIDAAYVDVKGTRRRFSSTTGDIDFGVCDTTLPASAQLAQPTPPDGRWEVTAGPLEDLSDPALEFRTYGIPFSAKWMGSGTPTELLCSWTLFSGSGGVVKTGEYGVSHTETSFQQKYRVPVYEWDSTQPATRAEFDCTSRY